MLLKKLIGALGFFLLSTSFAQTVPTLANKYDSGEKPVIARDNSVVVEVHDSGYSTLWYRVGLINGTSIEWGEPHRYDSGTDPSVAVMGDTVVEAHSSANFYTLYYRVGKLNPDTKTISWGSARQFHQNGMTPDIALHQNVLYEANSVPTYHFFGYFDDNGVFVDMSFYTYTLQIRMGSVDEQHQAINWFYSDDTNQEGVFPSLTVQDDLIALAFESGGYLFYKLGRITPGYIQWRLPQQYDNGTNPSIKIQGNSVVEMHNSNVFNRLWYHVGILNNDDTINWGPSLKYDRGLFPSLTLEQNTVLEVHQSDYFSKLYTNFGTVKVDDLKIDWHSKS